MTRDELVNRFPEIPADLQQHPLLEDYARHMGDLLIQARQPSPCATQHDAANHYYLKLIGPMAIHGYGLSSLDEVLQELQGFMDGYAADPDGFAASLLPAGTVDREIKGPGCA